MKRKKNVVSQDELSSAINNFLNQGGLIKQLPDEVAPRSTLVGSKFAAYEPVVENSTPAKPVAN